MKNKSHRKPEQVAVDIINVCRHNPQKFTQVVQKANLNNGILKRLMPKMISEGLMWKWRDNTYLSSVYGGQWVDRINRK